MPIPKNLPSKEAQRLIRLIERDLLTQTRLRGLLVAAGASLASNRRDLHKANARPSRSTRAKKTAKRSSGR